MRVLKEDGIEVWIIPNDPKKIVRCYFEEMEVQIDLTYPAIVTTNRPDKKVFRQKCYALVYRNRDLLLAKWDEINSE